MTKKKTQTSKTNLVIIESPYKVPTIKNYLGSNYKVVASMGHLRDLPKSVLGVDIENGFEPHYINIRGKGDLIASLKKEAQQAGKIFFATDPDREGEAISWHLSTVLGIPVEETRRVCFNELTKNAIKTAIKQPRNIDMNLVDSQQSRRILDRLVGYQVTPLLWKNMRSGLSAGRVQSAATRIIVDREKEIENFVPVEYWTIDAQLKTEAGAVFTAKYAGKDELGSGDEANEVVNSVKGKSFKAVSVKKAVATRSPQPPFTTSTLQQEASRKLSFRSGKTMQVAQTLYEGINLGTANGGTQGLITYMRTDSTRVSDEAASAAGEYIKKTYGEKYLPAQRRVYKTKGNAQDAHEAIRPASFEFDPKSIEKYLTKDQYRLYNLIWNRFMASQMASAEFDTVTADFDCEGHSFRANGSVMKFNGFLAEYDTEDKDTKRVRLPEIREGSTLTVEDVKADRHFTEPPARYNEGTLVKFLEEKGIGRPSTFAPIISTIIDRGYVERDGKNLRPTDLGILTNELMMKHFSDIVDYEFTAKLEDGLDSVANGDEKMINLLNGFYEKFSVELKNAEAALKDENFDVAEKQTDIICDKCGARMVIKRGRFGTFAACPNYPACRNTKTIDKDGNPVEKKVEEPEKIGEQCPECGADLVKRKSRFGEFIACLNYPKCRYTREIISPIGVSCPVCGGDVIARTSKKGTQYFVCINNPECKFISWTMPTNEKCPVCGGMLFKKKNSEDLVCGDKNCGYTKKAENND